MGKNLNPNVFFWNADRQLLEEFFRHFEITEGIDWKESKRTKYLQQIYAALDVSEHRREIESVMDDIHEMSIKTDTPEILISNLKNASGKEIDERIVKEGTLQDIAMWVYLNVDKHSREAIERYLEVDKLNHQMLFSVSLKKGPVILGWEYDQSKVEDAIRQHLVATEHRGRTVKIIPVARKDAQYYFVYFEDFHRNHQVCNSGNIVEELDNTADEMLFIYDHTTDKLYARLHLNLASRKRKQTLCDLFAREALNRAVDMDDNGKVPYTLEHVCEPGANFSIKNLPEFEYVRFKELTCIECIRNDKVTLQACDGDIYERIRSDSEKYALYREPGRILRIVLEIRLNATFDQEKPIKVSITQDKISHFKDPDVQAAVEKALREWNIAENPEPKQTEPAINEVPQEQQAIELRIAQ